ncbi:MAG: DUF5777 family beta-barrel protein [Chitinophagales bacterium]
MRNTYNQLRILFILFFAIGCSFVAYSQGENTTTPTPEVKAEESVTAEQPLAETVKVKPKLKATKAFTSIWLIDNQTTTVPVKGTFEFDIMHRFGPARNGYKDFFGFFAASNISLRFSYVPVENLMMGFAITKANMTWEFFAKYAIIKQTKGVKWKFCSLTYYGNMAVETRKKEFYVHGTDRLSFFHQLILARRFHERFAAQVAPSWTHVNVVDGYFSEPGVVSPTRKHDHFAISLGCSIMLKKNMNLIINYDQPLTKHKTGNPNPNLSFGLEFATSGHAFQIFAGQYYSITPQRNNYFNTNGWKYYLIGFNVTKLWNF